CLSTCPLVVAPPPPPSRSPYTTLFRSGGKDAGGVVHAKDHFAVLIAGVGGRLHRDEVLALLGDGVQLVEPVGHVGGGGAGPQDQDRKSTRLNSSHVSISYAVFCLKKKK